MKNFIFLMFIFLPTYIFSQIKVDYLYDKWICYKTTSAEGNEKNFLGDVFKPRTDTLEFRAKNKFRVYVNRSIEDDKYYLLDSTLIIGQETYGFKLIDKNRFRLETLENNWPASMRFHYYYVRLSESLPSISNANNSFDFDKIKEFLPGKWVRYLEGLTNGDTTSNSTNIKIDTLTFVLPDKVIITKPDEPRSETTFQSAGFLIGWNKNSYKISILDKNHFIIDEFNPNIGSDLSQRYYYQRIGYQVSSDFEELDCEKFRAGKFLSYAGEYKILIERNENTQTESSVFGVSKYDIKWSQDCNYTITLLETTVPFSIPNIGKKYIVEINSIDDNSYDFSCTLIGENGVVKGKITKIE